MASLRFLRFSVAKVKIENYKTLNSFFHKSYLLQDSIKIKMPSLSPTMNEGTIVKWHKNEGDELNPGDLLCDIQTDKAVLGFEYEEEGILAKIIRGDDSKEVKVGELIALVAEPGTDWKSVIIPPPEPTKNHSTTAILNPHKTAVPSQKQNTHLLGPAAKLLLEQYQLDITTIPHTGPHGVLTKGDVVNYIEKNKLTQESQKPTPIQSAPSLQKPTTVQPPPSLQKPTFDKPSVTGEKKPKKSTPKKPQTIPQGVYSDIPVTEQLISQLNQYSSAKNEIAHSYLTSHCSIQEIFPLCQEHDVDWIDIVVKITALALQNYPRLNGLLTNEGLKETGKVNISLSFGDLSPCLHLSDVPNLDLKDISQLRKSFVANPSSNTFSNEPSVLIHHLGEGGVRGYLPPIKKQSVCSLSISSPQLFLGEDSQLSKSVEISLCIDNRFLDEVLGSQFLQYLSKSLETPSLLVFREAPPSIDLSKLFTK